MALALFIVSSYSLAGLGDDAGGDALGWAHEKTAG
jgi:hypothetical protein